jgi:CDP-glycerol glycerophosphotransferase (TagB/SpsB family)
MDGFQIAKNVQSLSDEREKLSVDLADKSDQIRQLLAMNQILKEDLSNLGIDASALQR